MIVVSNSSPLISFAKTGKFRILKDLFGTLYIPEGVYHEVVIKGKGLPGEREIKESKWIERREVKNENLSTEIQKYYNLGRGEAESIILAKDLFAHLILIDERRARLVARIYELRTIGTLGLLEFAFKRKLIPDLRKTYIDLKEKGIRIDDNLINESLRFYGLKEL